MKYSFLGVLAVWICACASGGPNIDTSGAGGQIDRHATLVLHGGPIYTMQGPKHQVEAVAISGHRILKTGTWKAIKTTIGPQTKLIDLKGRTAIPGLTDAHMHLFSLGRSTFYVDLVGTQSIAEIKARLATSLKNAPPGQWVKGRGWDQNDWTDNSGNYPSVQDLDDISPNHPVALTRVDGHALWVNSKALQIAKIDQNTPAPEGGKIIKSKGRPSGIFVDNAMPLIRNEIPALNRKQLKTAVLKAQEMCLASGLSQVHDMGLGAEGLSILKELEKAGQLKLRIYAMVDGDAKELEELFKAGPRIPTTDAQLLSIRGVKYFVDGALGSRGAALFEPYEDDAKNRGLILTPLPKLEQRIRLAKKHGFQVSIHAIGDRGNHAVLDLYEKIYAKDAQLHRPRIEHAQILSLEDIERFARLGVIASMQPTHATSDMPWAEKRVGPERIKGGYAWRRLLTANATIAAGSDAPVERIEPKFGLYSAMTRQDTKGWPEGGWYSGQAMTASEAVASFTKNAAFAAFRESELGQIKVGYLADLTVLNTNPFEDKPKGLLGDIIELTIVNGKIRFQK